MSNNFQQTVSQYIAGNKLLDPQSLNLVALSGGADSVALLRVMLALGYRVEAVHCNFHLRGAESDRDENFVTALCRTLQVPLHIAHFDTATYASLHQVSIEMAARELRYDYFEKLRHDISAAHICVAHHRDDSVETTLMNLVRGTGIHGLTGIRPVNGRIIRPLLCISRKDILQYLTQLGQPYVDDSTNFIDDVTRNKIRLDILPLLRAINPAVSENICRTSDRLADIDTFLQRAASDVIRRITTVDGDRTYIHIETYRQEGFSEYILYVILSPFGFTPSTIEQIHRHIDSQSGTSYYSETHQLVIDRTDMIVAPRQQAMRAMTIPEEGNYMLDETTKITFHYLAVNADYSLSRQPNIVDVDAAAIRFPLHVRTVKPGDKLIPFGMNGSKLVSDLLTDLKLSIIDKQIQLVVTDQSDTIVWLVFRRVDHRFRVTSKTRNVLRMTISSPTHRQ